MQVQPQAPTGKVPYPFEHSYPTSEAAQRARDDSDFQRAIVAYRFWYPTISCEGIFHGAGGFGRFPAKDGSATSESMGRREPRSMVHGNQVISTSSSNRVRTNADTSPREPSKQPIPGVDNYGNTIGQVNF
jgi:hypothetical protein